MAVEEDQGTEQVVETEETNVVLQATPDVADDDDVEAHVWRAQS